MHTYRTLKAALSKMPEKYLDRELTVHIEEQSETYRLEFQCIEYGDDKEYIQLGFYENGRVGDEYED